MMRAERLQFLRRLLTLAGAILRRVLRETALIVWRLEQFNCRRDKDLSFFRRIGGQLYPFFVDGGRRAGPQRFVHASPIALLQKEVRLMGLKLMPSIVRLPSYAPIARRRHDHAFTLIDPALTDARSFQAVADLPASPCVRFVVSLVRRLVT